MEKMLIGIVGYGNIGKGARKAIAASPDMELAAVFTRRNPRDIMADIAAEGLPGAQSVQALPMEALQGMKGRIDALLLCGGSATDLPEQGPALAKDFNVVDSFDTHARIPEYFAAMDAGTKNTVAVISAGWDPGLFSMMRALSGAMLPNGADNTFWGYGVSQGHSDAIRRLPGVEGAIQYTAPVEAAVTAAREGGAAHLTPREKHTRICYVAAKPGADRERIERDIKQMPNYFADYDTTVHFVTMDELKRDHSRMPHGGLVIRTGDTGGNIQTMELSIKLDSNPEFTASIMAAYARAAVRMAREGQTGAKTVLDVPIGYLSPKSGAELRKELL